MANEIRDAFEAGWPEFNTPELPSSGPANPNKTLIYAAGAAIDGKFAALEASQEAGAVGAETWSALSGYPTGARVVGDYGKVVGDDAGTHTDPVVGGTVANRGLYRWSASPAGWKRIADLDADNAKEEADRAESEADRAESAAAAVEAMKAQFLADPDGDVVRQQLWAAQQARIADLRRRAMYFLDSVYGDASYRGAGSNQGGKPTVADLLPKVLIDRADHEMAAVEGYTNVYKVTLDKGANRPRGMRWAIFRNDPGTILPVAQHFAKLESEGDIESYMKEEGIPGYYDPTPGARVSDVFFSVFPVGLDDNGNFISGDPTGDGKAYYAQMTTGDSAVIAVRSDSVFEGGQSFDPQGGFEALVGVGNGALPVFDCTMELGEADFVAADGIYKTVAPVVAEGKVRYLNDACHNGLMIDPDGLEYPLELVASKAACIAKRGTCYWATPGDETTDGRGRMNGAILYINPRWGKDPTDQSDGTRYRVSITARAFTLTGANGATDWTNTAQGALVEGMVCIAGSDGQGVIMNEDVVYSRILTKWTGKHAVTFINGRLENCINFGVRGGANGGDIPIQLYASNVAGLEAVIFGAMNISPDHFRTGGTGIYCHGNVGGTVARRIDVIRYFSYNGWGIIPNSQEAYIDGAVFTCGAVERTAASETGLVASTSGDTPADRDIGVVTEFDGGKFGQHVYRADLASPGYERLQFTGGTIEANAPSGGFLGRKTYIRRVLHRQNAGSPIVAPAGPPGSVPSDPTSLLNISDCFLSMKDGYSQDAIQPQIDISYEVVNNLILLEDRGLSSAWNPSYQHGAGSKYRCTIIVDYRTSASGIPVVRIYPDAGAWNKNVYCLTEPTTPTIFYVNDVAHVVQDQAGFEAYQAAVAPYDADSIALFGDDYLDLFIADPRTGDLRFNPDCTIEFGDGERVVDVAGIRTYYDWNWWAVREGQPSYLPIPPKTDADVRAVTRNPYCWNYRLGRISDWALTA